MAKTNKLIKKCFFAAPLSSPGSTIRNRSEFVLKNLIRPALKRSTLNYEYTANFLDKQSAEITRTIVKNILDCDLFIADITGNNPNVMYELGVAHALLKPTVLIAKKGQRKIPFDIEHIHFAKYVYSDDIINTPQYTKLAKETRDRICEFTKKLEVSEVESGTHLALLYREVNVFEIIYNRLLVNAGINWAIDLVKGVGCDERIPDEQKNEILSRFEPQLHLIHDSICKGAYGTARSRLEKNFVKYCEDCKGMVMRSDPEDEFGILTIQTPVDYTKDEKSRNAYDSYIDTTIEKILNEKIRYKRLYIVTNGGGNTTKETMDFFNKLIVRAQDNEIDSLDHVCLGFVKLENSLETLFSNLDIHITSKSEFSLALAPYSLTRTNFAESIHVLDIENNISADIRQKALRMWEESNRIIQLDKNYYSGNKDKKTILSNLENFVNTIVAEL